MNAKLTLTVDKKTIEAAKRYAKSSGRSLSSIVEEYLKSITVATANDHDFSVSPLVESLWGSVEIPNDAKPYKEIISDALATKYLT